METPDPQKAPPRTPQAGQADRGRGGAPAARSWPSADGKYQGVRVGVTNGGCAGMSYTMEYAAEAKPFEEVMEDKGVKIFIDPKAILFLIGTELDFVQEKLGARFVFNNPNQTAACGCGESVQITPRPGLNALIRSIAPGSRRRIAGMISGSFRCLANRS